MSKRVPCIDRVICGVLLCVVLLSSASVEAASVWGGVYGWGRPTGTTVQYIDESLVREDLVGEIGMYGELIHDGGGPDNGYTLKAQSVLGADSTMQGYIAVNNYKVGSEIQSLDAWVNAFACDTYTVTGGTVGDVVEAIFTCSVSGTITIEPVSDTSPNSYGGATFNIGMHGTYGDPAIIPNWIDAGMYVDYRNNTLEILANDVNYYSNWDDDEYDLDRHTPVAGSFIEGQDYTISGNTVTINALFSFPVTMVSGHALSVESELDLSADTADSYIYPDRSVEVIADFWNTGITGIALSPNYQGTYSIEREVYVPEPASVGLLTWGVLGLLGRRRKVS